MRLLNALLAALASILLMLLLAGAIATANAQKPMCAYVSNQWHKNFCAHYDGDLPCMDYNVEAVAETVTLFNSRAGVNVKNLVVRDIGRVWAVSYEYCPVPIGG